MPPDGMMAPESILGAAGGMTEVFTSTKSCAPICWDAGDDEGQIPPREWLLGHIFCRRFLSSLLADGGVGKTALRLVQLVSLASGRNLTGERVFQPCRVLFVSLEDDLVELQRRILAITKHHKISRKELKGRLFLWAPKGLRLAEMKDGTVTVGKLERDLRAMVDEHKIDVISLDPFVKSHGLQENDNNAVDYVCTLLTKLAIEKNCAIDALHHTRKGSSMAGNADSGRGASAMKDAARLVYTLTQMTSEEAKQFSIPEDERRHYIRMDSGKVNIAPASTAAKWFKLVSVPLNNGTDLYPEGDEVQTVEPWSPPKIWDGLDTVMINRILDQIEEGLPNGSRYSSASSAGDDRAAWRVVKHYSPEKTEQQGREIIKTWLRNGTLYPESYDDPEQRKSRTGLRVDKDKRPTGSAP